MSLILDNASHGVGQKPFVAERTQIAKEFSVFVFQDGVLNVERDRSVRVERSTSMRREIIVSRSCRKGGFRCNARQIENATLQ